MHTATVVSTHFGRHAKIAVYTTMEDFANACLKQLKRGKPFDMVFIGVDNMLGVEVARNIREIDDCCPMFIVSKASDYGVEGYRLYAMDYLIKPVSLQHMGKAVGRIGTEPFTSMRH